MSQISKEIFDKIRSRFSNVQLGDAEGKTTLDSDQAVFFEFNYKDRGNIVLNLQDDLMKIYFNNKMVKEMDSDQSDNWHGWLRDMRKYSHANMLNFEVKNIDKHRLDRKDFEYLVKNSGEQDGLTMESKMYGGKQKSYQDLNGARMIVKHARTVDEEKRGARSRNVSAVYIENDQGERFKFPNTYLPAARAMTRHISNGGYPNDERGKHILDIMAEMMDLGKFSRRTKRTEYTEEAGEIISDATDRYYGLKDTLESMKKQTGYETYFENWSPDQIEVDENDIEDLKVKLTREVFDDELSDTLTNVGKAVAMGKIKREAEEDRIGSEAASLKAFAAGPDPIMMHPNPEGDADVRNYQNFIKNSNMPIEKRNLAMVQRIMMELSNRMVDDALAAAIGRLDMDDRVDAATAFAMAKKYLKGETEIQQPKAKKDRYGKDKVESWDDYERAIEEVHNDVEESRMGYSDVERLGSAAASKIDNVLRRKIYDMGKDIRDIEPGTLDRMRYQVARELGLVESTEIDEAKADPKIVARFAKVRPSQRSYYIMQWAKEEGIDSDKAMEMAGYVKGEYMGAGAYRWKYVGEGYDEEGYDEEVYEQQDGATAEEVGSAIAHRLTNNTDLMRQALEKAGGPEGLMNAIDSVAQFHAGAGELGSSDISIMVREVLQDIGVKEEAEEETVEEDSVEEVHEEVVVENYRQLALKGIGAETKNSITVGRGVDYYSPKDGSKHMGKITKVGKTDYELKDDKTGKTYKFKFWSKEAAAALRKEEAEVSEDTSEYNESLNRMKAIAGIGSNAKSNHGIRLGEEGYQITPRSIVAREMRKLQDLERNK